MNPYQVSQDPVWHRWVDGLIILAIGLSAGVVIAGSLFMQEVTTTTTTTEIIRRSPAATPQIGSGTQTDVPSGIEIEEI